MVTYDAEIKKKFDRLMEKLASLCLYLEDAIDHFYDLGYLDDDSMCEVLGLIFTRRSLGNYIVKCTESEVK